MLKGHLPSVIYRQVYEYTKIIVLNLLSRVGEALGRNPASAHRGDPRVGRVENRQRPRLRIGGNRRLGTLLSKISP